jgi:hypothetical protein
MKQFKENYQHRFAMIQDELKALREFIHSSSELQAKFGEPSSYSDTALTHLNNIEVACDTEDSESLRWKPYVIKPKMKTFKVDVTRTAYVSKEFIVEALTEEIAQDIALELALDEVFDDEFDANYDVYETTEINN